MARLLHAAPLAAVVALIVSGCLGTTQPDEGADTNEPAPPATEPVVRFIAIGDTGTGDDNQAAVAGALATVCAERGCDFAIALGDNIYEVGVTSPYDPQFELKFELPYQDLDLPFWLALGNHDNLGVRGGHAGGDFQVDYSHRTDRLSDKWNMPARWYVHEQGHLQFVALDTNIVFSNTTDYPQVADALSNDVDGLAQMAFVEETLMAPTNASWRFLYGHHPLYSNGDHGDTGDPWGWWIHQAVCSTGTVDVYFAGHDHDLQWLAAKPDECGATEFLVSGAGAKTRAIARDTHEAYFAQGDTLGFYWIEVAGDTFTGHVYDSTGKLLFERSFTRTAST